MLQVTYRLRTVYRLDLGCVRLPLLVGDLSFALAYSPQYDARIVLYRHLPLRSPGNIVCLPRLEVVHDVRKRPAGVLDIVDNPLVPLVDGEWLVVERVPDELGYEAPVGRIVFPGAIAVDRPDPNGFGPEHLR